jgi:hypothetical protein
MPLTQTLSLTEGETTHAMRRKKERSEAMSEDHEKAKIPGQTKACAQQASDWKQREESN